MAWACSQAWQLTPWHYRRKNVGQGYSSMKRMELLHDGMKGRDYGQLKDLISDRSRWRQDSNWECMSETCWKQQKTKEEYFGMLNILLVKTLGFERYHQCCRYRYHDTRVWPIPILDTRYRYWQWPGVVSADGGWTAYYSQLHVIASAVSISYS